MPNHVDIKDRLAALGWSYIDARRDAVLQGLDIQYGFYVAILKRWSGRSDGTPRGLTLQALQHAASILGAPIGPVSPPVDANGETPPPRPYSPVLASARGATHPPISSWGPRVNTLLKDYNNTFNTNVSYDQFYTTLEYWWGRTVGKPNTRNASILMFVGKALRQPDFFPIVKGV